MLANAMRILHFRSFLKANGPLPVKFIEQLTELNNNPSRTALESFELSDEFVEVMSCYSGFTQCTRRGDHGREREVLVDIHRTCTFVPPVQ